MSNQAIIAELTNLRKSYLYEDDEQSKSLLRERIKKLEQRILDGTT